MGFVPAGLCACVLLVLSGAAGCRLGRPGGAPCIPPVIHVPGPLPPPDVSAEDNRAITFVEMRNVRFRSAGEIVLGIRRMSGRVPRTDPMRPPNFDDAGSFTLRLSYGEIGLDMADLDRLMNERVLAYVGTPLRGVAFSPHGDRLKMTGTLTSKVPVRIEMVMTLCAIDGEVCMSPQSIKSLGLEIWPVLKRTGVSLDRFLDLSGASGLRAEGSHLVLDPKRVLDSPAIEGRVSAVRVDGNEVVLTFGRLEDAAPTPAMPLPSARSYLHFREGTLRFGRLLQVQADLQLVDADPADPFEFDLARYQSQLTAGYSRSFEGGGLLVVIPDLDDVGRGVEVAVPDVPTSRSDRP